MESKVFKEYFHDLIEYKKFILLYIVFLSILSVRKFTFSNNVFPKVEFGLFVFVIILGSFLILYGFRNKEYPHKLAFAYIMLFGSMILFLTPPLVFHDESTHFTRVENMAKGFLFPAGDHVSGYFSDKYYHALTAYSLEICRNGVKGINAVFVNNPYAFHPISSYPTDATWPRITSTPFYSYILPTIAVFIAKFFDLDAIYAIWFSRIPNLILYATIVYFAIKKAPVYKMPLLVASSMPIVLTIVPSTNYDSFNFAFLFLAIAYFIYMLKNNVKTKDLVIFFICCLLVGLIKPQFIIFCLLLFLIPKDNFKFTNPRLILLISIVMFLIGAFLLFKGINMLGDAPIPISSDSDVSVGGQIHYLLSTPFRIFEIIGQSLIYLYDMIIVNNYYYNYQWFGDRFRGDQLFNVLYFIFFMLFSIFYPLKIKLTKHKRLILGVGMGVFYIGMFFLIYVIWAPVGYAGIWGMQPRYFVPIFALIPLLINYPFKKIKNMELYTIWAVVLFSAGITMFTVTYFY